MSSLQTAERVSSIEMSDNVIYQRHLVAYNYAAANISGKVLEVGCGEGYGLSLLADKADEYIAIDKFAPDLSRFAARLNNVHFIQMDVPPLGFPDDTFDAIVSFQVIEHIEEDEALVKEMARVLKPGGKLILTTPNKNMSLTRNPWHIREYRATELAALLQIHFSEVTTNGVYGNEKVMNYYEKNKVSVQRITRFDVLNLQYRLPRQVLQIPYDILNRINRRLLLRGNKNLVSDIGVSDYIIKTADDACFDLLAVAVK